LIPYLSGIAWHESKSSLHAKRFNDRKSSPRRFSLRGFFNTPSWKVVQSALAIYLVIALPSQSLAQVPDLTSTSLEDLMNLKVTSVSKKEQKISQAPAAVFVISSDDIRRSGALNIPDLLRMVPGLEVAQLDASRWAISTRGFNGQFSNKLLVMIDGRTVYTPVLAGVFWDTQNLPLESIDRIEIIRGPGAAVWGANAVNGVINILTKPADATQGGFASTGGGNVAWAPEDISYGGKLGKRASYRLYADGFRYAASPNPGGGSGHDDWNFVQGGFRADSKISQNDSVLAEGQGYHGNAGEMVSMPMSLWPPVTATVPLREQYSGWNVLTRWNHTFSAQSDTSLQVYFDREARDDSSYGLGLNIFDANFQHHFAWTSRHDFIWGLGYRLGSDDLTQTLRIVYTPQARSTQLFSAFAQDAITLWPDKVVVSVGARVEHNDYTGFNLQPTARVVWTPDHKQMFWGAVSGADRTPARSDTAIRVNYAALPGPGLPVLVSIFGNPKFKNEHLNAFEGGYRGTWTSKLSGDMTVFYDRYSHLVSVEPGATTIEMNPAPVHLLVPSTFGNALYGETHGIEAFANWRVTNAWTLSPGYSFLATHLHMEPTSHDTVTVSGTQGGVPDHQAQLRSSYALPWRLQLNSSAYFVNRLPAQAIPSYTRLDADLTWKMGERVSIDLVGQNMLHDHHMEYSGPDSSVQSTLIRRDAYAKVVWFF